MKTNKLSIKVISLLLVLVLALAGCGSDESASTGGEASTSSSSDSSSSSSDSSDSSDTSDTSSETTSNVEKPEKITMLVDGTIFTKGAGREEFEAKWEELTGVDLEIIQPDHDAYYDVVGQTFASGEWPDVVLLNSSYYAGYAEEGVLWDMTEAWDNSDLKASGRVKDLNLVEGLKIDGSLYGIAPSRGGGCITYVKQAWLDNVGIEAPTNYEEYIAMLDAFTNGDPDGNGVDGDTYAVSAAGLIGKEIPYINYTPEFYQDAFPSFYMTEDGTWVDGFTEDSMIGALERLRDAYNAGYIDKETLTNGTSDCRNKFYEDKFGIFTYWAGTWATNLKVNLEANGLDGELVALPPIAEVGTYLERQAPSWSITAACENPEGVFEWFFETMLDGGEVQTLWTYGVEGVHWSTAAETVLGVTYEEGQFHMLENPEKPGVAFTKNHIDPLGTIANMEGGEDPGLVSVAPEAQASSVAFGTNSRLADLVPANEPMSQYNGDLITLKREIVANVVTQGASIEDEMQRFVDEGGAEWSAMIVDALNNN